MSRKYAAASGHLGNDEPLCWAEVRRGPSQLQGGKVRRRDQPEGNQKLRKNFPLRARLSHLQQGVVFPA